jgi:prepilin-type processing-associated H-X9-DG protein
MHQFHGIYKLFPSNGGWDGKQTILSTTGTAVTVETFDYTTMRAYQFGVGDPKMKPRDQTGSWAYSILPYVDQQPIFDSRDWTVPIPLYICTARRPAMATPVVAEDAYGKYISGGWAWARIDYGCNLEAVYNRPECSPMSRYRDGVSNTILIGEKAYDVLAQQGSWYYDESYFTGGSKGTSRIAPAISRDAPGINYKDNWGAAHIAGANFLFADGTARMIDFNIDPIVMAALLTPDGGEVGASPP